MINLKQATAMCANWNNLHLIYFAEKTGLWEKAAFPHSYELFDRGQLLCCRDPKVKVFCLFFPSPFDNCFLMEAFEY